MSALKQNLKIQDVTIKKNKEEEEVKTRPPDLFGWNKTPVFTRSLAQTGKNGPVVPIFNLDSDFFPAL